MRNSIFLLALLLVGQTVVEIKAQDVTFLYYDLIDEQDSSKSLIICFEEITQPLVSSTLTVVKSETDQIDLPGEKAIGRDECVSFIYTDYVSVAYEIVVHLDDGENILQGSKESFQPDDSGLLKNTAARQLEATQDINMLKLSASVTPQSYYAVGAEKTVEPCVYHSSNSDDTTCYCEDTSFQQDDEIRLCIVDKDFPRCDTTTSVKVTTAPCEDAVVADLNFNHDTNKLSVSAVDTNDLVDAILHYKQGICYDVGNAPCEVIDFADGSSYVITLIDSNDQCEQLVLNVVDMNLSKFHDSVEVSFAKLKDVHTYFIKTEDLSKTTTDIHVDCSALSENSICYSYIYNPTDHIQVTLSEDINNSPGKSGISREYTAPAKNQNQKT